LLPPQPTSTLFPYTTLFRSNQPSGRVNRLASALTDAGLTAVVAEDVWAALWTKFLTLASFGAVGSVTDAPYSVLRSRPGTRQLIDRKSTRLNSSHDQISYAV